MTTATPGSRATGRGAPVLRAVGAPVGATLILALALSLVGAVLSGQAAALGALTGSTLVLGFFLSGSVILGVVARLTPALSLLVALLTYVLQVAMLALVMLALLRSGALGSTLDARWLGGAVIAGTLLWSALQIVAHVRVRQPVYDLPARAAGSTEAGAR